MPRYILKDLLLFDPARTELWVSSSKAAWVVKPLWGFVSDSFPIRGQHRRPYLIICGLVGEDMRPLHEQHARLHAAVTVLCTAGCLAYFAMSSFGYLSPLGMLATMTLAEFTIAVSDVCVVRPMLSRQRHAYSPLASWLERTLVACRMASWWSRPGGRARPCQAPCRACAGALRCGVALQRGTPMHS